MIGLGLKLVRHSGKRDILVCCSRPQKKVTLFYAYGESLLFILHGARADFNHQQDTPAIVRRALRRLSPWLSANMQQSSNCRTHCVHGTLFWEFWRSRIPIYDTDYTLRPQVYM